LVIAVAGDHRVGAVGLGDDFAGRVVQVARHEPAVYLPADALALRVHQIGDRLPVRQGHVPELT
jgi:hypothetical protein